MQYLFHLKLRTTCSTPITNLATLLFIGAAFLRHPTGAQPHEGNCKRTSSSLYGCFGATIKIPIRSRGTTLLSPSEVQNASDRNVRRNERSCRPPQYLQESYGAPRPCEMQSLFHHVKRLGISLVQQTPAIINLILQRAIHRVRLPLHQSMDVQEVELSLADHKAVPIGEPEVLRPEV